MSSCTVIVWSEHFVKTRLGFSMAKWSLFFTTVSTNGANVCGTAGPEHGAGLSRRRHVWGQRNMLPEHSRRIWMLPAATRKFILIEAHVVGLTKKIIHQALPLGSRFHRLIAVRTICIAATKGQCATWSTPNVSTRRCLCPWWRDFLPDGHSLPLRWTLAFCLRLLSQLTFAPRQIGLLLSLDSSLTQKNDFKPLNSVELG